MVGRKDETIFTRVIVKTRKRNVLPKKKKRLVGGRREKGVAVEWGLSRAQTGRASVRAVHSRFSFGALIPSPAPAFPPPPRAPRGSTHPQQRLAWGTAASPDVPASGARAVSVARMGACGSVAKKPFVCARSLRPPAAPPHPHTFAATPPSPPAPFDHAARCQTRRHPSVHRGNAPRSGRLRPALAGSRRRAPCPPPRAHRARRSLPAGGGHWAA